MFAVTEPEITEILQAVSLLRERFAHERRSPQFMAAVGLFLAATTLQQAAGCGWLHQIRDPQDERLLAYHSREDVKTGFLNADHIAACPTCQNPHQLAATFGRLGMQIDQVFARIVEEAVRALK